MSAETELQGQLVRLPAVAASKVPVPGDGAVLFTDTSSGSGGSAGITAKLPNGTTVVVGSQYMIDALHSGARGNTIQTTATVSKAGETATLADAITPDDIGKVISIEAAGDGADLITTISAVDATGLVVTLADAATDGATGGVTFIGTADDAALTTADPGAAATMLIPPGMYLIADDVTLAAGTLKIMRGASFVILEGFTLTVSGYIEAAPDQLPSLADADGNGTFTHTYQEGFFGTAPGNIPTITGASDDEAGTNLLAALETLGLIVDSST